MGGSEEFWEVGGVCGSSDEFLGASKEFWEGVGGDFGGGSEELGGVEGVLGGRRSVGGVGGVSGGGGSKEFWGCRRSFKEWPQELTARE